jgi:hypothetical protein
MQREQSDMPPDMAWQVIRTAYRSSRELSEFLSVLKSQGDKDDYEFYRKGIATAIHLIHVELTDRALSRHPQLQKRIDQEIETFGSIR